MMISPAELHDHVLIHEASHITVANLCGVEKLNVEIKYRGGYAVSGATHYDCSPDFDHRDLITIAGIVGEAIFTGSIVPTQTDLDGFADWKLRDLLALCQQAKELLETNTDRLQANLDRFAPKEEL